MAVPDIMHTLLGSLKELPPGRWTCSVDGIRKGPVTEHKVGLRDGTTAWARWQFAIDGQDHDLEIERSESGSSILFDSQELPDPSIDIHPDTHGLSIVTVVKCHYTKSDGSAGEYRFDGTNASL